MFKLLQSYHQAEQLMHHKDGAWVTGIALAHRHNIGGSAFHIPMLQHPRPGYPTVSHCAPLLELRAPIVPGPLDPSPKVESQLTIGEQQQLPSMSALEVLQRRNKHIDIPALLLSAAAYRECQNGSAGISEDCTPS